MNPAPITAIRTTLDPDAIIALQTLA